MGAKDPLEVTEETTKVNMLRIFTKRARGGEDGAQVPLEVSTKRGLVDYGRQINLIVNQLCRLISHREVMSGGDPLDAVEKARLARAALAEASGLMNPQQEE